VTIAGDPQQQLTHRPQSLAYTISISNPRPCEFPLRLRLPWWLSGKPEITLNGAELPLNGQPGTFVELRRRWGNDTLHVAFPKSLVSEPLPGDPRLVAFRDGPVVLAGLNPGQAATAVEKPAGGYTARPNYAIDGLRIHGDPAHPTDFLVPDNEREWHYWRGDYRTRGQERDFRLIPLYEVRDEVFTVYFSI